MVSPRSEASRPAACCVCMTRKLALPPRRGGGESGRERKGRPSGEASEPETGLRMSFRAVRTWIGRHSSPVSAAMSKARTMTWRPGSEADSSIAGGCYRSGAAARCSEGPSAPVHETIPGRGLWASVLRYGSRRSDRLDLAHLGARCVERGSCSSRSRVSGISGEVDHKLVEFVDRNVPSAQRGAKMRFHGDWRTRHASAGDGDPPPFLAGQARSGPDLRKDLIDDDICDVIVTTVRRRQSRDFGEDFGTTHPAFVSRHWSASSHWIWEARKASLSAACWRIINSARGSVSTKSWSPRIPLTSTSPASSGLITGICGGCTGVGGRTRESAPRCSSSRRRGRNRSR